MRCRRSEKLIFLYNELDSDERLRLDQHVATCENCRLLLEKVLENQQNIQQVMTPPLSSDARLTDKIMNEVIAANRKSNASRSRFIPTLSGYKLSRIGLAALSILLIVGFIAEFNRPIVNEPVYTHTQPERNTIELNTTAFNTIRRQDSLSQTFSLKALAECIALCREKLPSAGCEDCQTRFKKLQATL